MDPYKTLGISKNASTKEIKDSYRKLALEKHPDKPGGSTEEFQQISEAYEILSDPQKKRNFDNPFQNNIGDFVNMNMFSSTFTNIFNANCGINKTQRTPDKRQDINLSLEEMYNGKTCKFAVTRNVKCNECDGNGGTDTFFNKCIICGGRGFRNIYSGNSARTVQCMKCDSEGRSIGFNKPCKRCSTKGIIKERTVVEAVFPKGCPNGFKIKMEGLGDYKPGKEPGDIIVVSKQKDHKIFTRHGKNLKCNINLTFLESVCGFNKKIKHLDGREIEFCKKDVTLKGDTFKISGEGMIKGSGFLEIEFNIIRPSKFSESDCSKLKEIIEGIGNTEKDEKD